MRKLQKTYTNISQKSKKSIVVPKIRLTYKEKALPLHRITKTDKDMDFKNYKDNFDRIQKERKELDRQEAALSDNWLEDFKELNKTEKFFKDKNTYMYAHKYKETANGPEECDGPLHYHVFRGFTVMMEEPRFGPIMSHNVILDTQTLLETVTEEEFTENINILVREMLTEKFSRLKGETNENRFHEHNIDLHNYKEIFGKYGELFTKENRQLFKEITDKLENEYEKY